MHPMRSIHFDIYDHPGIIMIIVIIMSMTIIELPCTAMQSPFWIKAFAIALPGNSTFLFKYTSYSVARHATKVVK